MPFDIISGLLAHMDFNIDGREVGLDVLAYSKVVKKANPITWTNLMETKP